MEEETISGKRIAELESSLVSMMKIVQEQHRILKLSQKNEQQDHAETDVKGEVNFESMELSKRIEDLSKEIDVLKHRLDNKTESKEAIPFSDEVAVDKSKDGDEILKATSTLARNLVEPTTSKPDNDGTTATTHLATVGKNSNFDSVANKIINFDIEGNKNVLLIVYAITIILLALYHKNGLDDGLLLVYCIIGWKLELQKITWSGISVIPKLVFALSLIGMICFSYNNWATSKRAKMEIVPWTWYEGWFIAFYGSMNLIFWKILLRLERWIGYNDTPLVLYALSLIVFGELGLLDIFLIPILVYFAFVGWIIGVRKAKFTLVSLIAKLFFWGAILFSLQLSFKYAELGYMYAKLYALIAINWFLIAINWFLELLISLGVVNIQATSDVPYSPN